MIEKIPITGREAWLALRKQDVTASAAAALLGVHEFTTAFGLYALKAGLLEEDPEESAPMRRGRLLEPVAVEMLREERPQWAIERGAHYYRDPEARIGATPDVLAINEHGEPGVVQLKNVEASIFRRKWKDEDGELAVPLWIACQAIVEAFLTGATWAAVAPLVVSYGVELPIIDIPIHAGVMDRIRGEVEKFWGMVERREPPAMDYGRDGETIARLYAQESPGKVVDLRNDNRIVALLVDRAALKADTKDNDERVAAINNEIKAKLGGAEIGLVQGFKVTWKTRKAYVASVGETRVLRVTEAK